MKIKRKPISLYFPISRVDEAQRIVEGYAFVNETVPGEGGVRLKRSAMEDATEDYVRNGTCREIHQPKAAGKPLDVTWDEKGAYLRMKVVDDQAWAKVTEGVYKGFSVGVTPKVMRGNAVTACEWWDTSLIDRGKDREAVFSVWRSGEIDPDAEVEVEIERASFAEYLEGSAPSDLRDMALNYLWSSLMDIQYGWSTEGGEMGPEDKEAAIRATCTQFTEFMIGAFATGQIPNIRDADSDEERGLGMPEITRTILESKAAETGDVLIQRAELEDVQTRAAQLSDAQAEIARAQTAISTLEGDRDELSTRHADVQRAHEAAIARVAELETTHQTDVGRIAELEQMPRTLPPARGPFTAVERQIGHQEPSPDAPRISEIKDRMAEIARSRSGTPSEQDRLASEFLSLKSELQRLHEG